MSDETMEPHSVDDLDIGAIQWHCSEDDGPPDVGLLVRLDASMFLWAGEITRRDWEDAGDEAATLGDDSGWWAILYEEGGGKKTVLGRFIDQEPARLLIEALAFSINPPRART